MSDLTGQTIGQYYVVQKLGGGGMADVYQGYQSQLERYVAMKFIRPEVAADASFQARFSQEAKAIARLSHANIVHVYDFGQVDHRYYLVMEYVEGGSLGNYLSSWYASGRGVPVNQALSIIQQVGSALDYAHQQGIIHRDVKPDNILLTQSGRVILADFGIAKIVESPSGLTQTGMAMGTPAYMAPEQIQGDKNKIGPASDLYSLGIIVYEMATGQPPFTGHTPMAVMLKHLSEAVPPPRALNPQLPPPVEQVILKALAKEPAARYQSAHHLLFDLQQAISKYPQWTEMGRPFGGSQENRGGESPISDPQRGSSGQSAPPGQAWGSADQSPTPGQQRGSAGQSPTPGQQWGSAGQSPTPGQQWGSAGQSPTPGQQRGSAGQSPTPGQQRGSAGQSPTPGQQRGSAGQSPTPGQQRGFGGQSPTPGQQWSPSNESPAPVEQWSPSNESPVPAQPWSPTQNTVKVVGFGRRAVAYFIDGVLLSFVGGFVGVATGLTIGVGSAVVGAGEEVAMSFSQLVSQCLGLLINGVYFVAFWATTGQTIGKMVMGIKVVDTNGQIISWGKAMARYIGYVISGIALALGFAWVAFDDKRQGWHDKIAKTYVVHRDTSFSSEDEVTFIPSDPGSLGLIIVALLYGIPILLCVGLLIIGVALVSP